MFEDAGMNNGEFTATFASTDDTEYVIGHTLIRGVHFTGSVGAGKIIAAICGKHMKKCSLELGGSDPYIVLDDADLDKAVQGALAVRLFNCGQICVSPKRLIVAKALYADFKAKLTEALKARLACAEGEKLGPIARIDLLDSLKKQVLQTIESGASVVFGDVEQLKEPSGGEGKGNFFSPMILEGVSKENPGYNIEFFGPVFVLYSAENEEEAVGIANGVDFGLGGAIFSKDEDRAEKLAMEIETGSVSINAPFFPHQGLPFGGTKQSGMGREGGVLGFREFTNIKTIATP